MRDVPLCANIALVPVHRPHIFQITLGFTGSEENDVNGISWGEVERKCLLVYERKTSEA